MTRNTVSSQKNTTDWHLKTLCKIMLSVPSMNANIIAFFAVLMKAGSKYVLSGVEKIFTMKIKVL